MTRNSPTDTERDTTHNPDHTAQHAHADWEHGQPCPECGHNTLHTIQLSGEKYHHENGEAEHIDWTAYREDIRIECDRCNTLLFFQHPDATTLNTQ